MNYVCDKLITRFPLCVLIGCKSNNVTRNPKVMKYPEGTVVDNIPV